MNNKNKVISILGENITITSDDYISLTDMLKAKDGEFFISDWLRNRNTVEYLGIWERIHNPNFNYGEFATIKSSAGLNSYKISVKENATEQEFRQQILQAFTDHKALDYMFEHVKAIALQSYTANRR